MTVTARKSNPGFLTDDELVASFCVRTDEFESMVEALRECTGNANTHQIVIGPRGSGKTSLLLRIAAEVHRDEELSSRFIPVVYAEESYEVSSAGEFWLECLSHLADQAPRRKDGPDLRRSFEDLRQIRDDRTLVQRCLGVLQDFADLENKRLVLIVENLNMLLGDIGDEDTGWQLRHTLQTEPRILLLASATSRFDEIDNPDKALYDLFRVLSLTPLDQDDCATLWHAVSGQRRSAETIQALRILTGGNPRLLTIVARFGANLSFRELMADLLNLVDDHTEYFKSHLDGLPAQERKVYLALVQLWKPVSAREVADRARLDSNQCSAHLKRLTERGAVVVAGGTERRKLYYVAERLYNIYYLMRRARGRVSLIEALIRFMEAFYSPSELVDFVVRTVREAMSLDGEARWMHQIAFDHLLESPLLSAHREELSTLTSWIHTAEVGSAQVLVARALEVAEKGHQSDAIALWDEAVRQLETSNAPADLATVATALNNKGTALYFLNQTDEAFEVWDEVVRRFGSSQTPEQVGAVAMALNKKALVLRERGRPREALAVCEEVLQRLKRINAPQLPSEIADALLSTGSILHHVDRPEEALRAWDDLVRRFGERNDPTITKLVCSAYFHKGAVLAESNRLEEAMVAWDHILEHVGASDSSTHIQMVVRALASKATALFGSKLYAEALDAWDDILTRFGTSDSPTIVDLVSGALVGKGSALIGLSRFEEALEVWDEVLSRPTYSDDPTVENPFSVALAHKSMLLDAMGRKEEGLALRNKAIQIISDSDDPGRVLAAVWALTHITVSLLVQNRYPEALAVWEEIAQRSANADKPAMRDAHAVILARKGDTLAEMNRPNEALTVWDDVVRRFGSTDTSTAQEAVAMSLFNRGSLLADLNRPQDALDAMDSFIARFATTSAEPSLRVLVTTALLDRARALTELNRLQEAVAAYDDVLDRHAVGTTVDSVGSVVAALVGKGTVQAAQNRPLEALTTLEDAVRNCGTSDHPMLRHGAKSAQLKIAEVHLGMGRGEASVVAADRLFEPERPQSPEIACQGHLIRARAHLLQEDEAACNLDVEAALSILSDLGSLPKETLDGLCWLAIEWGPEQVRDLIVESPASSMLFPLTTALEKELGIDTREAKEIEEVAEDIRRDLERRRKGIVAEAIERV